ncbi:hypothetical protein CPLU01_15690 [Colletotrichum plurivorum]|uniref:Uncharacterized protein n=1 Tax=Colletotrichum plurivorum TaxID=2175906 RepID=A0A8H6MTC6_9PEZI|nr:hypothetical protein CPLU01_15690 [Colletotrichum plurivorum]
MRVTLFMAPTRFNTEDVMRRGIEWEVRLRTKTRDLARFMREGFHWTTANFDPEMTRTVSNLREDCLTKVGWTCTRNYYLSDLGDNPCWAAKLVVCARSLDVLSRFKICDLRPDMVYHAYARNDRTDQFPYEFESDRPHNNHNDIYGDLPLEEWWPWPKRRIVDCTEMYPDL